MSLPEDQPLVVQLFGAEASFLSRAVGLLREAGYGWFDLNMGCSVSKVLRQGAGAAMLGDTDNILEVARAMLDAAGPGRVGFKLRLGLDEITGTLEVGKRADVITVDLHQPHFTPVLHGRWSNVAAHLVFTASGHDVDSVWVDGHRLVAGGEVLTVDVADVMAEAQAAAEELFDRRDVYLAERDAARLADVSTHTHESEVPVP